MEWKKWWLITRNSLNHLEARYYSDNNGSIQNVMAFAIGVSELSRDIKVVAITDYDGHTLYERAVIE